MTIIRAEFPNVLYRSVKKIFRRTFTRKTKAPKRARKQKTMTDAEFITANYDSFLDNVLLNQTKEFWAETLTDEEDGAGYLMDGLHSAMKAWRLRVEADEPNGCVKCGAPGHDAAGHELAGKRRPDLIVMDDLDDGPEYDPFDPEDQTHHGFDPHHSEEWWRAIDDDDIYQETFCGKD